MGFLLTFPWSFHYIQTYLSTIPYSSRKWKGVGENSMGVHAFEGGWRDNVRGGGESSLGARLRTRKVTGRDASLPAPLLTFLFGLVGRGTVGALPQAPQGTLSLDPARGRRKGTKSPLDPFSRLSWSRFYAPSACSFWVLCLSSCLLTQTFREEPFFISPFRNARTAVQPLPPHSCASRSADTQ